MYIGHFKSDIFPKEKFVNSVVKLIERKNEDSQEVKSLYPNIGSRVLAYSVGKCL